MLVISGGAVTVIKINGVTTGLTSGTFYVPSSFTVAITYTVVPTAIEYPL